MQEELLAEIELSIIPFKLDNKVRVEILNEPFIKYLNSRSGQHDVNGYIDEEGMGIIAYSKLRTFFATLIDAFKEYQNRGNV